MRDLGFRDLGFRVSVQSEFRSFWGFVDRTALGLEFSAGLQSGVGLKGFRL